MTLSLTLAFSASPAVSLTVTLTVTTENGCSAQFEAHSMVNVYPVPQAGFDVNPDVLTTAQPLATFLDRSAGSNTWEYDLGDGNVSYERNFQHNYYVPGEYSLRQKVTNQYGCIAYAYKTLKVEPVMTFYIPNAFTPDGDGTNETFKCYGLNIEEFRMEIYNRWGELVFESTDVNFGWDGIYQGRKLDPDVYDYYLQVTCYGGFENIIKGNVTLMK
jgi:gliding motility-associated-like protein